MTPEHRHHIEVLRESVLDLETVAEDRLREIDVAIELYVQAVRERDGAAHELARAIAEVQS